MSQRPRLCCSDSDTTLQTGFVQVREQLDVPTGFPNEVVAQAQAAAERGPQLPPGAGGTEIRDATDLDFVAIDPPGSRDLDQAYHAERRGDGYRVHYAIADVGAFVTPGSALDDEALARGVTLYSPDMRSSLHPEVLNEDAASLLADQRRQVAMWTLDLDEAGRMENAHLERAEVINRRAMTYREAQTEIDQGTASEPVALLAEIGRLREDLERERGAVSLQLPSQEIVRRDGVWSLEYDETLPVEGWNAQISLMTGMAAAELMVDAGVGLLRTMPPPNEETVARIRRTALALDIDWPADVSYADRVRELAPVDAAHSALLSSAARGLRGAGYAAFENGRLPELPEHSAIASVYAHVTAPLRRVCDRFTNEVLLAICADREPPEWAVEKLAALPGIMGRARQRDRALERSMVDFAEAVWMSERVGEVFHAAVIGHGRDSSTVMVQEPAVIASVQGERLELGERVQVRLDAADPSRRQLRFSAVEE